MDRRRAAGALLALAACIACSTAAPTASNQTALELLEGPSEGCYYNFQHYGEGDRIMTNEPCLNCTCHNRMLMCYLRVCPFTKPIGQDCTIEKRADQCCPIVTCPDVPVDLLTSTSTSSPAEYGATGLGKVDKYGCSINGKYFSEGSKVPPSPNKPCEHCYCIRNMTTCVMQECTLHVDGCTPIYHKDVCCPVRYSCDHQEDEMLLLDDMTTTVRPTPGFLLTTTTMPAVTQMSQDCVHDDQIFADGALIKTEKACEHCYCMKGDIVCVVQECGTPMENEGKNCTSLPPRQGQCCPDTYICEGDELTTDITTDKIFEDMSTLSPPRKTEGSGYRNEPDEPYTDLPIFEGSGEEQATTLDTSDLSHKQTTEIIDEVFAPTEESLKPSLSTIEPDKGQNTVPDELEDSTSDSQLPVKTTQSQEFITSTQPTVTDETKETDMTISKTTTESDSFISKEDELIMTTKSSPDTYTEGIKITTLNPELEKETANVEKLTTPRILEPSTDESSTLHEQQDKATTPQVSSITNEEGTLQPNLPTTAVPKDDSDYEHDNKQKQDQDTSVTPEDVGSAVTTTMSITESFETTSVNPVENEIHEDVTPILPPGRIPGEGDCLLNGITYKNNTNVPNINNCHSSCKCVSSIVKCDPIICSPPPEHMENMSDCQPIYDTPDACCPTYVCHSRETIPPESHNQMSGTESPKPSPAKPESECHGDECKSEVIVSTSPETEQEVKDCKNGVCTEQTESSSDASIPLDHPESCIGDSCSPSKESCTDGKCEQPTTSEHICNNENGCQPSEAEPCDGNNCGVGSETSVPKDEAPICEDPEGCKVSDTPEVPKPVCEGDNCGSTLSNEEAIETECTEENCKRKDQAQEEHKPPSDCSGSDCLTQETTDSILKDQSSKESTTETIEQGYSKSDEEPQKTTQTEEKQDVSPELSTEKSEVMTEYDAYEHATDKESHTTKLHITKVEEAVTEQYKEPESEDHQTYTTKSEEQATDSLEHTVNEVSTDRSPTSQYEEQSTELPKDEKEDVNIVGKVTEISPTGDYETSTEILHVDLHDEDTTEVSKVEEFTEKLETPTEPSNVFEPSDKDTETGLPEQEYTKKYEILTEKPEMHTTHLDEIMPSDTDKHEPTETISQDSESTHSDLGVTQSSVSHEITTESYVKEDDSTGLVTDKTYDHPDIVTETFQSETTEYDPYVTKKEPSYPQTPQTPLDNENKETETTQSSVKDEEEYGSTHKTLETISDVQNINTTPKGTQEYATSSINLETHATASITAGEPEMQNPVTEEGETNAPVYPVEESTDISEGLDMNDSSTQYPEKAVTGLQESTAKTKDESKISSTISEAEEEHTDKPIHDFNEMGSKTSETLPEDTTHKESSAMETETEEIPSKETVSDRIETTTSSILSDLGEVLSTKLSESEIGLEYSPEPTLKPEIIPTKSDESSSSQETDTSEPTATRREEGVIGTTESLKQPDEETTDTPDKTKIITESDISEQTNEEMTETPLIPTSEDHIYSDKTVTHGSEKEDIPVFVDITKTEETPLSSSTETYEIKHPEHHVTETTDFDMKGTYSDEKIQTPTEYPYKISTHETQPPEIITQTQESVTKSDIDLHTEKESFTHDVKEEEKQTESPMSLVTEEGEHITLVPKETVSDTEIDRTTQAPQVTISESHETKPDKPYTDDTIKEPAMPETEAEKPYTESSEKGDDAETPSPVHEKEGQPESLPTASAPEYTTTKVLEIQDEEKTSSPMTDEKLAPTTEFAPVPTNIDSEISAVDVSDESSTKLPHSETSEESYATDGKVSPTIPVSFDHKSETTETLAYDKPIEEATTKIDDDFESTTVRKITEPLEDNTRLTDGNMQQPEHDTKVTGPTEQQDKYTTIPEPFTTKYPDSFDHEKETVTPEDESDKHDDTVIPHEYITTEAPIYTKPSESPDIHSTVVLDYEKSTVLPQSHDVEKDIATPADQDVTTLKEAEQHTTESSETTFGEDGHRRTLSPDDTVEPEQITEGHKIPSMEPVTTALPEVNKTPAAEHTETVEHEQTPVEHVTPISHVTEGEMVHTQSHKDQYVPVVTETSDKHSTEIQDITTKRTYTEFDDNEHLQTALPTSVPSDQTVPQETETESSVPKESETSDQIETQTIPSETDMVSKETEPTEPKVTEASVPEVTESSITEVTKLAVPEVTESAVHEVTEVLEPEVTKASEQDVTKAEEPEVTKVSIQEVTEAEAPEVTKAPVHEITEAEASEVTKMPVEEVTDIEAPIVTKAPVYEVMDGETPEITKSEHEITDSGAPEVTIAPVHETTHAEIPEITKSPAQEITHDEALEVTKEHEITDSEVIEVTKAPVHEITDAETSEVTKSPLHEITEADIDLPEVTKSPVHDVTDAEVPEVTKTSEQEVTEAEAPEVTKSPIHEATDAEAPEHEVTDAEAPEVTKTSEHEVTESEAAEVTKSPVHEATDAETPEHEVTDAEAPEVTKTSEHEVTVAEVPEVTKAPVYKDTEAEVTEAEAPEVTKAPIHEATKAEAPEATKTPEYEVTEAEAPNVTEVPVPEVTKMEVPEVTEVEIPEVTKVPVTEATEELVPEGTEPSVPKGTEASVPEGTETSVPKGTEASVPEVTELLLPETSDTSVPKETQETIKPESVTYQPKDEKTDSPSEPSPTSESVYPSSETTEYMVELEEHKFDHDTSSVAPVDMYTTRSPEVYQTERGDQPLDTDTEKSTQEDVQEQYTTKEPLTEKEKLTTVSQEQPSEHPTKTSAEEEILPETELTTEKVLISSESPAPAPTEESIHTTSSEVQGSTISPTETVPLGEHEKHTTLDTTTEKKYPSLDTEKVPEPTEQTTGLEDELIPTITKATTAKTVEEATTHSPVFDDKIKPEEPVEPHQTTAPELPKPGISETQPTEEIPSPDFPQGGTSGYGQEPDYGEEDQVFGPGTCRYGGKVYVSAQQIPRDDPCDFCFCFRSDIICLQQSCPPPIHGCHEEPIQGFCCPRYECPVSMATTLNVTTTTTTTTTTLPPHFFPHAYKGAAQRRGCQIKGHTYKVGEVVRASSGPCLHCTCGGDGQMKCDPKACTPEPMLRQMIAAAVSAKRRR